MSRVLKHTFFIAILIAPMALFFSYSNSYENIKSCARETPSKSLDNGKTDCYSKAETVQQKAPIVYGVSFLFAIIYYPLIAGYWMSMHDGLQERTS